MTVDALNPGPEGNYPHFPRDAMGHPAWSDAPTGLPVVNGGAPMPRGIQGLKDPGRPGRLVTIDVTPRHANGEPINPPVIPPRAADAT